MQEMTLHERYASKFEEFIDQYIVDFLGIDFIRKRLPGDIVTNENKLYIQNKILPLIPDLISRYNNLRHDNDKWIKYLVYFSPLMYICVNIPVINDIMLANWVDDMSNELLREKLTDIDFNNKYISLINDIVVME